MLPNDKVAVSGAFGRPRFNCDQATLPISGCGIPRSSHRPGDSVPLPARPFGIYTVGTFKITGEADESKQPMFNLATVNCEKQSDDAGRASLECKVTKAVVWASAAKPDTDNPNCSLDLDSSSYSMKELQKGVLTGIMGSSPSALTM
jgi:hypothetical protein